MSAQIYLSDSNFVTNVDLSFSMELIFILTAS